MRVVDEVFHECAAALQFPYYFGNNWAALDECLVDLEWLPGTGYILALAEANTILCDGRDSLPTFLRILDRAGMFWPSEPNSQFAEARERVPTPFHVIFHAQKSESAHLERMLSALGYAVDDVSPCGVDGEAV